MADLYIAKGETFVLLIDPRDTRDKGWLLSGDVRDVILTIRETENSAVILQLHGQVEKVGTSVDDPGILSVLVYSDDTVDLPAGDYWFDVTLIMTGHWFDVVDYDGLYLTLDYGRIKDADGEWLEVESGVVELTDNAVNFVQVTKAGAYKVTTTDYERESSSIEGEGAYVNYNLYRIVTLAGEVVDVFPFGDWFDEGAYSGLNFVYEAGKVLDDDNVLQTVNAGTIALRPNILNYIEVDNDGVVSANVQGFTTGKRPLYTALTATDSIDGDVITTVVKQENTFILDDRDQFVRGDTYTPSLKAEVTVTWTPTKAEE